MNTSKKKWKLQTMPFSDNLKNALQQQHHAAQFIALVGRHLVPQQTDDSNTNMQYLADQGLLAGNELSNGLRLALQLTNLKLCFVDNAGMCENEIILSGKSKKIVFDELKNTLASLGIDVSNFINKLHYEIPTHKLDEGAVFSINNKLYFQENTFYRHNAEIIINEIASSFDDVEPVRIWPHHFDTGTFITVAQNDKGELSKSIGLGWTIPDGMVDEPYYYLSFWSEKPTEGLKKLKPLDSGEWMMPGWNGAVLKNSEILKANSATGQHQLVKSFFNSGIKTLMDSL